MVLVTLLLVEVSYLLIGCDALSAKFKDCVPYLCSEGSPESPTPKQAPAKGWLGTHMCLEGSQGWKGIQSSRTAPTTQLPVNHV